MMSRCRKPRNNLAALGHKPLQQPHVAVRNRVNLLGAELAHLLAAEKLAAAAGARPAWARAGRNPVPNLIPNLVPTRARVRWSRRMLLLESLQPSCFLFTRFSPASAPRAPRELFV